MNLWISAQGGSLLRETKNDFTACCVEYELAEEQGGSSKHSTTVLFWSILRHRGRGPPETKHSDLMYGIFVNKITPALLPVVNLLCFT